MSSSLGGILGGLVGKLAGNKGAESALIKLAPMLVGMLAGGGLTKILGQAKAAGLGSHADSWVGKGPNQSISADDVKKFLSSEQITEIAGKLGISTDDAAAALAHALPEAVNQATPDGHVPAENG
jgi:uncharacterized protein YidB (DUF937 family)